MKTTKILILLAAVLCCAGLTIHAEQTAIENQWIAEASIPAVTPQGGSAGPVVSQLTAAAPTSISDTFSTLMGQIASGTNLNAVVGAGRALKGNKNLYFADVAYGFNANVGLVAGVDRLTSPGFANENNIVKGGITLQAQIHPFTFIGSTWATNVVGNPYAAALVASPTGGSSDSIGTIIVTGISFDVYAVKNWELILGVAYETRSGAGYYDGGYGMVQGGLGRRF